MCVYTGTDVTGYTPGLSQVLHFRPTIPPRGHWPETPGGLIGNGLEKGRILGIWVPEAVAWAQEVKPGP